jgi:osmoprotectant transport system permease protein
MTYLLNYPDIVLELLGQHILLTGSAILVSAMIALPLGWLIYYQRWLSGPVLSVLSVFYTVPSIAMIILLIPLFGLNRNSVLVALIIYCQVILVRNVLAGLDGIAPAIIEAARGMGMGRLQLALRVQLPVALPVILAGVRIASVAAIAIATIGAKFGSGGLGKLLFEGITQGRPDKILLGAVLVSGLALAVNILLRNLENRITSKWIPARSPSIG